eukprot:314829-Prymnesium_polylepis.1
MLPSSSASAWANSRSISAANSLPDIMAILAEMDGGARLPSRIVRSISVSSCLERQLEPSESASKKAFCTVTVRSIASLA